MSAEPWCTKCGMHRGEPCYMTDHPLVRAVITTSRMLDRTYEGQGLCREAIDRRRWDKIAEELGELSEAYGLFVGENPRKGGPTADLVPALGELLDIAACALGAWVHLVEAWGDDFDLPDPAEVLDALTVQTALKSQRLAEAIAAGSSTGSEGEQ